MSRLKSKIITSKVVASFINPIFAPAIFGFAGNCRSFKVSLPNMFSETNLRSELLNRGTSTDEWVEVPDVAEVIFGQL